MGVSYRSWILGIAFACIGVALILAHHTSQINGPFVYSEFTSSNNFGKPLIWMDPTIDVVIYGLDNKDSDYGMLINQFRWLYAEFDKKVRILGPTTYVAKKNWYNSKWSGRSTPPVNISFTQRSESDLFVSPSALAATTANPNRSHTSIVTGALAFDSTAFNSLPKQLKIKVIRHELGHLLGFGHDESDVMSPELRSNTSIILSPRKVRDFKRNEA